MEPIFINKYIHTKESFIEMNKKYSEFTIIFSILIWEHLTNDAAILLASSGSSHSILYNNSEFKSMIVELYKTGRSVKELSREYGVSEVTIYKWIKQISPITTIDDTEITLEEIKRMKQEMLRLQEENEILKKAMTIFARK